MILTLMTPPAIGNILNNPKDIPHQATKNLFTNSMN